MDEFEPRTLMLVGALAVGVFFGLFARISGFCLRSAINEVGERQPGRQVLAWALAIMTAVLGTQLLVLSGIIDLSETLYLSNTAPAFPAIVLGGLLFGLGMMLARGCGARHLVLAASGNLRSWIVLTLFGIVAYATLRGLLALPRTWLEGVSTTALSAETQSLPAILSDVTGVPDIQILAGVLAIIAIAALTIARATVRGLAGKGQAVRWVLGGIAIGATIPAAWYVTAVLGFDDFEPTAPTSMTFTAPIGNAVQYIMTFTGATADFGVTAVAGVLIGAFTASLAKRNIQIVSFETPGQLGRYALGAVLMGFGGVLALGCTIGAGLSGVSTLSLGSMIALLSIITGGALGRAVLSRAEPTPICAPAE